MNNMLPLSYYPDPILRKKAVPIDPSTIPELGELIEAMTATMFEKDGIGLAAPQIGKSIRLIVIAHKEGPLALINPELFHLSFSKESAEEGCLSIPGVAGIVKRHKRLDFRALDKNGKKIEGAAEGLFARVLQHEIDHLNGVLFIDRSKEITHGKIPDENN